MKDSTVNHFTVKPNDLHASWVKHALNSRSQALIQQEQSGRFYASAGGTCTCPKDHQKHKYPLGKRRPHVKIAYRKACCCHYGTDVECGLVEAVFERAENRHDIPSDQTN